MNDERTDDTVPDPLLRRATRAADNGGPSSICVSADAAAAWADGALDAGELSALTLHAAGCARCRSLLAAMVQSEPPARRQPWWSMPLVRWAAPLAAAAVALAVWVTVQPASPQRMTETPAANPAPAPPEAPPTAAGNVADRTAAAAPQSSPVQPKAEAPRHAGSARSDAGAAAKAVPLDDAVVDSIAPLRERSESRADVPAAVAPPVTLNRAPARSQRAAAIAVVMSPDPSSRWRLGQPGAIERSTDGGQTWDSQLVEVTAMLTAGSSPAPAICWIVGAAGTVLRTVDGRTWQRLASPDAADLVAVAATDAGHATVTTADGRSFVTSDGGATWSRLPVQENPAAPF